MLNKANLVGRWTKDFDLRYSQGGTAVGNNTLAVDRRKDKNGNKETDFIPVVILGKQAENCANYSGKGRLVAVSGMIQTGSYEKDGQKRYKTEVLASEVHFLDYKESNNTGAGTQYQHEDMYPVDMDQDDLPF